MKDSNFNHHDNSSTNGEPSFAHDNDDNNEDDLKDLQEMSNSSIMDITQGGEASSDEDDTPKIVSKETQAVFASKFLVALVMIVSAGVLGYFAYKLTWDEEIDEFQAKFLDFADEIARSGANNAHNSYLVLESFSRTVTSLSLFANATWPFLTLPNYESRADDYMTISGAESVSFCPIVPDSVREKYEAYTVQEQGWIQAGLDHEYEASLRAKEDRATQGYVLTNKAAKAEAEPIAPGTNSEGFSLLNKATRIQPYIWRNAKLTNRAIPDVAKGPHVPIWQTYPAPRNSYVVGHNLDSIGAFNDLIVSSHETYMPTLSDVLDNFLLFGNAQTVDVDPKSVLLSPIFRTIANGRSSNAVENKNRVDIVGYMIVIKKWRRIFEDVLYNGAKPVVVVLKNDCDKAFTYEIVGPNAYFMGEGDLHDTRYDDMKVMSSLSNQEIVRSACTFTLHIYPTTELEEDYQTNMPIYVSVAVLCVFAFTSLVFLLYDSLVSMRQRRILSAARATSRIVSNLFPKAVRERMIQDMKVEEKRASNFATAIEESNNRGRNDASTFLNSSPHGSGSSHARNPRGVSNCTSVDIFGSKPIAELFPATTIMFGDMVGFTAWSSVRDPQQVFTLLETVYYFFDMIAKKRRIFKVETIGDCYVAVAGLPMPRKDHHIVMARFAMECLEKMNTLAKQLEASLGPDTGDLTMRIGLHSGPVTAGVLRGEKGRFQLFGDSMNTAARMESTCIRSKIQVSRETAKLLIASKKEKWVTEREGGVFCKGKGELQTYWLSSQAGSDAASSVPELGEGSESPENEDMQLPKGFELVSAKAGMLQKMAVTAKTKRLVEWNSVLLGKLLKQILLRRKARKGKKKAADAESEAKFQAAIDSVANGQAIDEVQDTISLPHFDQKSFSKNVHPDSAEVPDAVLAQLLMFVSRIADLYKNNPFHNFEHASHVTMSVTKLLSRIVKPTDMLTGNSSDEKTMHDHTFGITSDPLTQFACVLSALIHDADHYGVSNSTLIQENDPLAAKYDNKSVAEQNSVDLCWDILMGSEYAELREAIYTDEDEFVRFRQIIVNIVLATDIMDKELAKSRKKRWEVAFSNKAADGPPEQSTADTFDDENKLFDDENKQCDVNRRATIVLEHLIQASDVSHTMQHWHVFKKWNQRLFCEVYETYLDGRMDTDPSVGWYKGEIGFFDFYIIPLAKKLETCGVFGVSSHEYLGYAEANRIEWELRGEEIVQEYLDLFKDRKRRSNN